MIDYNVLQKYENKFGETPPLFLIKSEADEKYLNEQMTLAIDGKRELITFKEVAERKGGFYNENSKY